MSYQPPDHFRYVKHASSRLGLKFEDLDGGGGYLFRVSNGRYTLSLGCGRLCPYSLNSAAAFAISKDKAFTSRLLTEDGIPNLGGRAFFLTDLHGKLRQSGYELPDAREYLREVGWPCFCKPLSGSQGDFAERIENPGQFDAYVDRVRTKHDSIIIQKFFSGEEYRVFVLDGRVVFSQKKAEPFLLGDGLNTVGFFVEEINERLRGTGISLIAEDEILFRTDGTPIGRNDVPPKGERLSFLGRRNFSVSREAGPLLDECPENLADLARRAANAVGLRIAGVDLLIEDPGGERSVRVIEVNGKPGIHALEILNRWDLIEAIWGEILEKAFREAGSESCDPENWA